MKKKLQDRTEEELIEEGKKAKAGGVSTALVCAVDVVYIGVGAVLEFVKSFNTTYMAYLLSGILLIFGIAFIVKYFIRENYHDANNYGFSIGTFMVILGALGLSRLSYVAENIIPFLGICALVTSITVLQNTIQLKTLRSRIWWLVGIFALVAIAGSAVMIVDVFGLAEKIPDYSYWALMGVGAISLLTSLIVFIQTKFYGKRLIRDAKKAQEEARTPVFIPGEEKAQEEKMQNKAADTRAETAEEGPDASSASVRDPEQTGSADRTGTADQEEEESLDTPKTGYEEARKYFKDPEG